MSRNPLMVANRAAGREAIRELRPLCTLRYSATHSTHQHLVYKLDAVDAYDQKLVKQISVAGMEVHDSHNRPFVRLLKVEAKKGKPLRAQLELDRVTVTGAVQRAALWVYAGDHLEDITGRALYREHHIEEIKKSATAQSLELRVPGDSIILTPESPIFGDIDSNELARLMIRRTIKEHLDKEMRLRPQGIKVLSLFFIGKVEDYRAQDEDGNLVPGPFARLFEEEYVALSRREEYHLLFAGADVSTAASDVHNGYFSIDRTRDAPYSL